MKYSLRLATAVLITAFLHPIISPGLLAKEIRVAVASNFNETMKEIVRQFEIQSVHQVTLVSGSTGKHYAQIKNAAPFDILFAADSKRPKLLEQEGIALPGSRYTYAVGKLILWSPIADVVDPEGMVLTTGDFRYLAVANPKLAPYGLAAEQVLKKRGLWTALQGRLVRGENIGQTFQFVQSGNAELGFIALSQIKSPDSLVSGSYWKVPQHLYDPIEQQAVLLKDSDVAHDFMSFVKADLVLEIIQNAGYETP